jgi:hypothetical protein
MDDAPLIQRRIFICAILPSVEFCHHPIRFSGGNPAWGFLRWPRWVTADARPFLPRNFPNEEASHRNCRHPRNGGVGTRVHVQLRRHGLRHSADERWRCGSRLRGCRCNLDCCWLRFGLRHGRRRRCSDRGFYRWDFRRDGHGDGHGLDVFDLFGWCSVRWRRDFRCLWQRDWPGSGRGQRYALMVSLP